MMQDLSPAEIEALSKAIGPTFISRSSHPDEAHSGKAQTPQETKTPPLSVSHVQLSQLEEKQAPSEATAAMQQNLQNVEINLEVILGKTRISIAELTKMHPGHVIPLDKLAGEPVDLEANGKLIARGEVVVIEDNFGIHITEIVP